VRGNFIRWGLDAQRTIGVRPLGIAGIGCRYPIDDLTLFGALPKSDSGIFPNVVVRDQPKPSRGFPIATFEALIPAGSPAGRVNSTGFRTLSPNGSIAIVAL
jgi:hypothetical protein